MMRVIMEGGDTGGSATDFLAFATTEENPGNSFNDNDCILAQFQVFARDNIY